MFSSKVVGTGFSGPVRLATFKATGRECAVKRYDKNAADNERIEYLKSEAEVYLLLDHPNICKLFAIYEDDRYLWIVMEYCAGQELYQRLQAKKVYAESDAAHVTRQMAEAVHYLHSHHIVHRDLKLENWLYESDDMNTSGRVKLIDFGFSKFWHPTRSKNMEASCGSLTYVSPERVLVDRIMRGAYSMDGSRWAVISDEAKDFVRRLLVVNPKDRMTSGEALSHPWIAKGIGNRDVPLQSSVLHSLRQFAVASHLKRAALTMIAYSLSTKDIDELALMFQEFDRNQNGCISLTDFMENFSISNCEIEKLFNAMTSMKWAGAPESEVCYSDFVAALLQTRLRFHEEAIREAFLKFDVDRSGYITADDLRSVIGDSFEGLDVDEVVRAADTNGDGRIDYEEFLAVVMAEVQDVSPEDLNLSDLSTLPHATLRKPSAENAGKHGKGKVLKQLLGVVDSSLAKRDEDKPLKRVMTKRSRSSPQLVDLRGPPSPHARPWDSRLADDMDSDMELATVPEGFVLATSPTPPPPPKPKLAHVCDSLKSTAAVKTATPTSLSRASLSPYGIPTARQCTQLSTPHHTTMMSRAHLSANNLESWGVDCSVDRTFRDGTTPSSGVSSDLPVTRPIRRHSAPARYHEDSDELISLSSQNLLVPQRQPVEERPSPYLVPSAANARVGCADCENKPMSRYASVADSLSESQTKRGSVVIVSAVSSSAGELYLYPSGVEHHQVGEVSSAPSDDRRLYFNFDLII